MKTAARPTQKQLRAGEAATSEPARLGLRLIGWKPLVKNALRGFADVELPNGLWIREVPVLSSNGKCWASLPSKPVLDRDGKHIESQGKKQYAAILEWRSREPRRRFLGAGRRTRPPGTPKYTRRGGQHMIPPTVVALHQRFARGA